MLCLKYSSKKSFKNLKSDYVYPKFANDGYLNKKKTSSKTSVQSWK